MNRYVLAKALKITSPVFFGYIAIGIAFGFLLSSAGYPWWLSVAAGLIMYTGAGQFFIVGQLVAGAPLGEILLAQALLSVRHIFYGLALISKYRGGGIKKPYLIFAITDETFALVQSAEVPRGVNKTSFYALISALDQSYWCLGSLIGALAYTAAVRFNLAGYLEGADFALTSLFIVLLIDRLSSLSDALPAVLGGGAALACVILFRVGFLASSNIIWLSICAGLAALLLARGPSFFERGKALKSAAPPDSEKPDAREEQK